MMAKNFILLLLLLLTPLFAAAEQYQAPITDTHWKVVKTPLECGLTQDIPDYGSAGFYRKNNGPLMLKFITQSQPSTQNKVDFEVAEAPWQNSDHNITLTAITPKKGQKTFTISGLPAARALSYLQDGRFPLIRYHSQTTMKEITVLLSTIHLSDSLPAFKQCLANLYPDDFHDLQHLTIYFGLESAHLDMNSQKALTRLANYVKVDNSIQQIHITSHTDNHGRRRLNIPLSKERAISIKNFLVKQCKVPEKLIETASMVDHEPAASNKTQIGRAHNRRAEIELIR